MLSIFGNPFSGIVGLVWVIIIFYTLFKLFTSRRPKNMNRFIWFLLIFFISIVGVPLYWIVEKNLFK